MIPLFIPAIPDSSASAIRQKRSWICDFAMCFLDRSARSAVIRSARLARCSITKSHHALSTAARSSADRDRQSGSALLPASTVRLVPIPNCATSASVSPVAGVLTGIDHGASSSWPSIAGWPMRKSSRRSRGIEFHLIHSTQTLGGTVKAQFASARNSRTRQCRVRRKLGMSRGLSCSAQYL